jgi:uncharacterized protein (TIGR02270 family)
MTTARFIPEIVDQQQENAVSLWLVRDKAVGASSFRLADLVKLDERIEASIDGLRIAEAGGWSASHDELEDGGAGGYFVAGVLAVESDDPDRFDQILERAYASAAKTADEPYHPAYDPWRGLVSALAWVGRKYAAAAIERLLDTPRPRTRWLGVAACGARRWVNQPRLEAALADQEPLVRARAARTIGELGRADSRAKLNTLLTDPDDDCRFWAAWSASRLGIAEGVEALAELARSTGARRDRALELLLRCLPMERAHAFLRQLAREPTLQRTMIRAAGAIGDGNYLPWLVRQTSEPSVARIAGNSFALITGADLAQDDLDREPPETVALYPDDDPEDDDVELDDDEDLAWPDPERLGQWWKGNQHRFAAGTAYFRGSPKASTNWLGALSEAPQRQRWTIALELALSRPEISMFEVRARGDLQQRLLRRAAGPV